MGQKAFQAACKRHGLRQICTRPYTPKTNGKAERFIQTSWRERAYARAYNTSHERTFELPRWHRATNGTGHMVAYNQSHL
ncbi:MAG: transposase family protein [Mesorhizobium sp.]|nr:MAG: hypothetical protein EOR19_31425 [Mesorhizobium sp.]TIN14256.1 MAG: transposase family protein [Mesorhizobium sp.]